MAQEYWAYTGELARRASLSNYLGLAGFRDTYNFNMFSVREFRAHSTQTRDQWGWDVWSGLNSRILISIMYETCRLCGSRTSWREILQSNWGMQTPRSTSAKMRSAPDHSHTSEWKFMKELVYTYTGGGSGTNPNSQGLLWFRSHVLRQEESSWAICCLWAVASFPVLLHMLEHTWLGVEGVGMSCYRITGPASDHKHWVISNDLRGDSALGLCSRMRGPKP